MKKGLRLTLAWTMMTMLLGLSLAQVQAERPRDPWVHHLILDQRPNMIAIALHKDLWVAYDATDSILYKAWKGSVNFNSAVSTGAHGPQPTTTGIAYVIRSGEQPAWRVEQDGQDVFAKAIPRGYRFVNDQVVIRYELALQSGQRILVEEIPEVVTDADHGLGLTRLFLATGVPQGVKLSVALPEGALAGEYRTNGAIESGRLVLNPSMQSDISVFMTTFFGSK